jgi:hypothetical protein
MALEITENYVHRLFLSTTSCLASTRDVEVLARWLVEKGIHRMLTTPDGLFRDGGEAGARYSIQQTPAAILGD